jgi:hypothetical protein
MVQECIAGTSAADGDIYEEGKRFQRLNKFHRFKRRARRGGFHRLKRFHRFKRLNKFQRLKYSYPLLLVICLLSKTQLHQKVL